MNYRIKLISLILLLIVISTPTLAWEKDYRTFSLRSNPLYPQSATLSFNSDSYKKIRSSFFGPPKSFEFNAGYMEGRIIANRTDTKSVKVAYAVLGNMAYSTFIYWQNPYVAAGSFVLTIIPGIFDSFPDEADLAKNQHRPVDYQKGFLEGFNDKVKNKRFRDAVVFMAISYGLSAWYYSNNFNS